MNFQMLGLPKWFTQPIGAIVCDQRDKFLTSNGILTIFGPFVWDVKKAAEEFPEIFDVGSEKNMYGSTKTIFQIKDDSFKPDLTNSEKKSIDHIIGVSSKKYWDNFIKLLYSTHPIASSERYSYLNLGEKAAEYRELRDA